MNDVAQIVHLGAFDSLLLHKVLRLEINSQRLQLVVVLDHALHQFKILRDDASLELRAMLAEINTLVRHTTTHVAHHDSASRDIFFRHLELWQGHATIPDASLAHPLSRHEGLTSFGVLWVVFSPVEDPHVCVVSQVEWCLVCRIHVVGGF